MDAEPANLPLEFRSSYQPLGQPAVGTAPPAWPRPPAAVALRNRSHLLCCPSQDERLVVFPDIRPAAAVHLQVIPRRHIKNLSALRPCEEDAALGALRALCPFGRHISFRALAYMLHTIMPRQQGCTNF